VGREGVVHAGRQATKKVHHGGLLPLEGCPVVGEGSRSQERMKPDFPPKPFLTHFLWPSASGTYPAIESRGRVQYSTSTSVQVTSSLFSPDPRPRVCASSTARLLHRVHNSLIIDLIV
jgi:hypothetical protein